MPKKGRKKVSPLPMISSANIGVDESMGTALENIVSGDVLKVGKSSSWVSYKMLSFLMVSMALLSYIFREQLLGSETESTDPSAALLLNALSSNEEFSIANFFSNPTPFFFKVFESCKANLTVPELLAACGMDLCDYVAKIMPPLNRLPGSALKVYKDGAIDVTPTIEVLEKLDPILYKRYFYDYSEITSADAHDLQIMSVRYQTKVQRELIEHNISGDVADFLIDLGVTSIYSAVRTCAGSANLLKTFAAIQPGIISAGIVLEFVGSKNIINAKKTGIPHATVIFKYKNNKISFTGDAWVNMFCSNEEIENAKGDADCASYGSSLWATERRETLFFPTGIHTLSSSQFTFFSNTVKKVLNFSSVIHNKILEQPAPRRIFPKGVP